MSDETPRANPAPPPSGPAAPAGPAALEHVVDDLAPRTESAAWAYEQITQGRSPEDVTGDLLANGWGEDDAAEMVEDARRQTRHLRGVRTREDVAAASEFHYRRSMGARWFVGMPLMTAAWRLLNSLAYLMGSRRRPPAAGPEEKS